MAPTTGMKGIVGSGFQGTVTVAAGYGAITSVAARIIAATSGTAIGSIASGFAIGTTKHRPRGAGLKRGANGEIES